ncbi:MAG: ferredoxin--NADP reductase [Candidatus Micrarchaeales archaeon]
MATYPIVEKKYFISEKIDETPEVLIIGFKPEEATPSPFDPGMFMMISGIDKTTDQKYVARAYSIASDPSSQNMEFFVIKEPTHGEHIGRSHFADVQIGDPFILKGPNGQFRFDPAKDSKVLFIAGGTGLAPFMSMLRHMKIIGAQTDTNMLYSVKFPTEIIRKDELNAFSQQLKLKMTITVTRPAPGDGWTGQTGHIDSTAIQTLAPDFKERMCYVCGPLPFVKAIKDAMTALGVPPERVSADVWG